MNFIRYDSRPDTWEHIHRVQTYLTGMAGELLNRAHRHDQSKLRSPEVEVFDEFTPLLAGCTYGSEEYKGYLAAMGKGLEHHYRTNDHHPEFFGKTGLRHMDLLQIAEMLCDWKAASERHDDGDIARSIEQNAERFGYGEEMKNLLMNTARRAGWLNESR